MALHDDILREIRTGRIPFRFKTSDLKKTPGQSPGRYNVGSNEYAENSIKTVPRNHSICPDGTNPGDYVRKGRNPAFYWYGEGTFELILNREHYLSEIVPDDEELDTVEGDEETLIRVDGSGVIRGPLTVEVDSDTVKRIAQCEPDPVAIIVAYIANQPFQAYYRRKPVGSPTRGWGARLDSYFWPSRTQTWAITRTYLNSIASQIQHAIERLKQCPDDVAAADDLLDSFKATCVWGGVKLPEADPRRLAMEVLRALRALSLGRPPSDCRLNSAWTKLYALALPERCVIYDSRVAAALTAILDPVMHLITGSLHWKPYARLGTIAGRGGSRPRALTWKWPVGYGVWNAQLAANLLCRKIVDHLNTQAVAKPDCRKSETAPWSLREVEAVLFMEGY